ncbi:MAG: DUF4347 domain-containing protein, partial [Planctomycetota bacterium]
MPLIQAIHQQLLKLRQEIGRFLARDPARSPPKLDLQFLEDRVLYNGLPMVTDPLVSGGAGVEADNGFAESVEFDGACNPNAFTVATSGDADPNEGDSNAAAQVEIHLQALDSLLRQLDQPNSSLDVDDAASESESLPIATKADPHPEPAHELMVIDTSVPNSEGLIAILGGDQNTDREFTVLLVDSRVDGVAFVSEYLANSSTQYSAIHLVTHGFAGGMLLGSVELSSENLAQYATQFEVWQSSLTADADLLLYGCMIAANPTGNAFVDALGNLLKVDVAASTDLTGATSRGGDWVLEYYHGDIETGIAFRDSDQQGWQFLLPTNNAPILDSVASPTMGLVLEGATNPSGVTIASLVVDGSITDPDGAAVEAIAITALNTSLGAWQYSLDGGSSWLTINAELLNSSTNELALLLGPTAQLRLIPFGDLTGTANDAITFRAWDQTSGSQGQYTVITATGGTTAFSSASDTASITVAAVNDAPTFFSGDGIVTTAFDLSTDDANSVAIQPDGKILVGGRSVSSDYWTDRFAIARYNADGSLDTSFGVGGKVTTTLAGTNYGQSIVVQPDGKILLGGFTGNPADDLNLDYALLRYNSDGTLDTSFGTGGSVVAANGGGMDYGQSVVVQTDGKILFSGSSFGLIRYLANGALDTSFGTNGMATTNFGIGTGDANQVAVQADGKILLAGLYYNGSTTVFAVARHNANGTLDTSFGTGGIVTTNFGSSNDSGYSLAIQSDGKLVVGGTYNTGGSADFALVRYNANGSLDTSFGTDGKVTTPVGSGNDQGRSVSIQADGKIVLGGWSNVGFNDHYALVRYNVDGTLDTSFGTGGKVTTNVGDSGGRADRITIQPDGRIVIVGEAGILASNGDFGVIRYNPDGSLDAQFDLANTLGSSVSTTENGSPVTLDSNVRVFDAELSSTNFSGATLTLARNGGSNSQDLFSATGTLGALNQGGFLVVGGTTIGMVTTNSGGTLVLTFNNAATNTLVNSAMQQIAYANASEAPPSSVQIDWSFSDGNSGAQGTGGDLIATGNVLVNITSINDAPVAVNDSFTTNEDTAVTFDVRT